MHDATTHISRRNSLRALAMLPLLSSQWVNAQESRQRRQQAAPDATGPRVALVLGSGSARGFAHIGVIKALEAAKIRPDLIVGSSAGAMIGAFYAAGYTGAQMEDLALKVKDIEIVDLSSGSKRGMVTGDTLQNFVNRAVRERTIEQLNIPFITVATTLRTGEATTFRRGDVGMAVRASCSVPGVFIPPRINDIDYVDGGLVSPVPVRIAREAGADIVIAVDVSSGPLNHTPVGIYEQVMHAFDIMGRSLSKLEADQADIVIRPDVARIASTDFNARGAFIQIGLAAGTRYTPVIQERITNGRNSRRRS
jgi:NTE family protein